MLRVRQSYLDNVYTQKAKNLVLVIENNLHTSQKILLKANICPMVDSSIILKILVWILAAKIKLGLSFFSVTPHCFRQALERLYCYFGSPGSASVTLPVTSTLLRQYCTAPASTPPSSIHLDKAAADWDQSALWEFFTPSFRRRHWENKDPTVVYHK